MKQTFNNSSSDNRKQLANVVNGAKNEVRSMSLTNLTNLHVKTNSLTV